MVKALEVKSLRKVYGKRSGSSIAVNDVSFSVEPGQFFGFLGPNGAGKSTTIHCITGIARPNGGSIELFGIDVVKDYREARKKVGLAPQEFNVDFFSKVWKILDYVGGYYGMKKDQRHARIEELLARFELEEHRNKSFQKLSGGLKRRVMIARAMVHDPEILILDEPTAGVDVELRHSLWNMLRELNKEGKTILLTSHYLEEVELLCTEIAMINRGKIVMQGSKDKLLKGGRRLEDRYLEITRNVSGETQDEQG